VWLAREALEAGRLGATDVRELIEDATQVALLDQERAGLDVLTTGEMGRVRFIIGFYDRLHGIRVLEAPRKLGQPHWDTNTPFQIVEKLTAPDGLGIVEEFRLARSLTTRKLKATVPGPYTLLVPLKLGSVYRDRETLLADLVDIVNAECRALVEAGADFIQIDEPHSGMYAGSMPHFATGVNRAVEGVKAKIAVHVCFGNLYGRPFAPVRSYRHVYPALSELTASQIVLEYANRGMDDLPLWKEFPTDKELGAGVIDVKAFKAESAPEVAERIRAILQYVAPEKLWVNPDCGFWETPRWATRQKLAALVDGARIVRKELGGRGLQAHVGVGPLPETGDGDEREQSIDCLLP
jgi:5-methyltetrahydropteroyltriglutamate--homocysteine methyltransferase